MILLLDNFVTSDECKKVIQLHQKHSHLARDWFGAYPIDTSKLSSVLINKILKRTEKIVQKYFNSKFIIDWAEVKLHTKGSHHPFHYDEARPNTTLASVIYLNDTTSGQIIFKEGIQVTPKSGRIITYNGKEYLHGVNKCSEDRYTIPIWYKHS